MPYYNTLSTWVGIVYGTGQVVSFMWTKSPNFVTVHVDDVLLMSKESYFKNESLINIDFIKFKILLFHI